MSVYRQRKEIEEFIAAHCTTEFAASKDGDATRFEERRQEPIAIVGLAGYFPSCMNHLDFWRALDEDRCLIQEVPQDRFPPAAFDRSFGTPGTCASPWGGFIPDIRSFDREFFGFAASEAEIMDPQVRLLLMSVYHTFEDAGHAPESQRNSNTGVFVGFEFNEYLQVLRALSLEESVGFFRSDSMMANQISYAFDLRGTSEVVNAMCAGGALAIHRAVRALRSGEIDQAIVGAANIMLDPETFLTLHRLGQLSPESSVHSFGKEAAGYLRGESVASMLLKPLSSALAAGDSAYALIRGSAVNTNGRSGSSITMPSIESHTNAILRCYRDAGVDVRDITYIEAQGMGSPLTDLAEWESFNRALRALAHEQAVLIPPGNCRISTLKPMTGHMHAASAVGAVFKIVRSLQTGEIPGINGFSAANPLLDLRDEPCQLAVERVAWSGAGRPRLAGLHSFGAGGTNIHLLVEEYPPALPSQESVEKTHVFPVSARSNEELHQIVRSLCVTLKEHKLSSEALATTLQLGRDGMESRVAFIASSVELLRNAAERMLSSTRSESVISGSSVDTSQSESLAGVVAEWMQGKAIAWPAINQGTSRLHLPGYPFRATSCWPSVGSWGLVPPPAAPEQRDCSATAERLVRRVLGDLLGLDPQLVDLDGELSDLGFNSLLVLNMTARLREQNSIVVEPSEFFLHRSPRQLAGLIDKQLCGMAVRKDDVSREHRRPSLLTANDPLAIIGLAGTYPKAVDFEQFWNNLINGVDCTCELPATRWSPNYWYEPDREAAIRSGKYYAHRAGFLDDIEGFDCLFFNLSPTEAKYMHVKERLLMQCSWHALEDAGYTPASLAGETVGVFAGVSKAGLDSYRDSYFSLANRISYRFNFTGPSLPIDTACSSSLSAVHEACLHIQAGECTMALAGGVNAYTHPSAFAEFSRLRVMSPDGVTRAFGADANGFTPGEGVGVAVIKPLNRAIQDGDNIRCVIRGTSLNHGGKTNGYTVPNPEAHRRLIRQALNKAGVSARDISYVEAHGTGTPLGDPIEIQGLTSAFREDTQECQFCAIGSVKTNIGHLEAAAGIAGLTKVVLQMEHGHLVPSLHAERVNPEIEFSMTPFRLQRSAAEWNVKGPSGEPIRRLACVSSFGAGGSNAHVVLEEYPARVPGEDSTVELIVLSAKSESSLRQHARSIARAMLSDGLTLADVGFTLQVGREPMRYRLALVAGSVCEAADKLNAYAECGSHPEVETSRPDDCAQAGALEHEPDVLTLVQNWLIEGKLGKVAKAWLRGIQIPWSCEGRVVRGHRVGLPGYPFETERFELPRVLSEKLPAHGASVLHPLLHRNISDLARQGFSSAFNGDEPFFADHVVRGQKLLSGAAFLELARAAVQYSLPEARSGVRLRLTDFLLIEPIVASDRTFSICVHVSSDGARMALEVHSEPTEAGLSEFGHARVIYARGFAELLSDNHTVRTQGKDLSHDFPTLTMSRDRCYEAFRSIGVEYGPAHMGLRGVFRSSDADRSRELLAQIAVPENTTSYNEFTVNPFALDSAFQAALGFHHDAANLRPAVPCSVDMVDIYEPVSHTIWAVVRDVGNPGMDGAYKYDLDIYSECWRLCASVKGLTARVPRQVQQWKSERMFFVPEWRECASVDRPHALELFSTHTVVFCGVESVRSDGLPVRTLSADGEYQQCVATIFQIVRNELRELNGRNKSLLQIVVPNEGERGLRAGLTGLIKTAHLENPAFWGQLVRVSSGVSRDRIPDLIMRASLNSQEQDVLFENERFLTRSWRQFYPSVHETREVWKRDGTYLITGGAGGLGRVFSREIAERVPGVNLVLVGRTPEGASIQYFLQQLGAAGAHAEYCRADVSSAEDVKNLIGFILKRFGSLAGVLHCAGVIRDNYIVRKQASDLSIVLASKTQGTLNLDSATQNLPLDLFVMFSSASAALGYVGQADYAAANAFLDEFARYRHQLAEKGLRSGRTLSVNWPLWRDGTMNITKKQKEILHRKSGMVPMSSHEGLGAFYECVVAAEPQVMVIFGDAEQVPAHVSDAHSTKVDQSDDGLRGLLEWVKRETAVILGVRVVEIDPNAALVDYGFDLLHSSELVSRINKRFNLQLSADAVSRAGTLSSFSRSANAKMLGGSVVEVPPHARRLDSRSLSPPGDASVSPAASYLRRLVAKTLGLPETRIDIHAPLEQYGLDSLMMVEMTEELEKRIGAVSKTLFFEYRNVQELAEALAGRVQEDEVEPKQEAEGETRAGEEWSGGRYRKEKQRRTGEPNRREWKQEGVAIVGVAGRYAGARDVEELWRRLRGGEDCITEIPEGRWNHQEYFDEEPGKQGKTYAKWGGFLEGVDEFDPLFFNISPREAEVMEPQERLFLECAYEAVQDAGYRPADLGQGRVGVYVGVMYEEYQLHAAQQMERGQPVVVGASPSSIANRVSYFCNFQGPSLAVDSMCSSSLTSIHLGCESLLRGETDAVLAGGVNVSIHVAKYLMLAQGKFASSEGRCKSFGEGGDGYVPGEGVGVVVLKRLSDAEAQGDHIYGVIRGTAINHGGKSNGYTVPTPQGQAGVIREALEKAGIEARTISYVEAHGTGTALGDPIEITGLERAFGSEQRQYCAIGSVKSNIGHCESAAGIAGLTKVLLQMQHEELVPSLHCQELNRHIAFENTPFYVQKEVGEWKRPKVVENGVEREYPRRAGISSFGAGGSNAHVLVEEYRNGPHRGLQTTNGDPELVVLSGKKESALRAGAERLLQAIQQGRYRDEDLPSLAYTLQVGRDSMEHRLAILVRSLSDLALKLSAFLQATPDVEGLYISDLNRNVTSRLDLQTNYCSPAATILEEMAERWVLGYTVDWTRHAESGQRVSLPGYPFDRKQYWLPRLDVRRQPSLAGTTNVTDMALASVPSNGDASAAAVSSLSGKVRLSSPARLVEESAKNSAVNLLEKTKVILAPLDAAAPPNAEVAGSNTARLSPVAPAPSKIEPDQLLDIEARLKRSLADALYLSPEEIDSMRNFIDLGLDSVIAIEWVRTINETFGTSFAKDIVYENSNLWHLAQRIRLDIGVPISIEASDATHSPPLLYTLNVLPPEFDSLKKMLRDSLAAVLYIDAKDIVANKDFGDYGLDSVIAIEWLRDLHKILKIKLSTVELYANRTVDKLAAHITCQRSEDAFETPRDIDALVDAVLVGRLTPAEAEKRFKELQS